jgi:hypothetical protein
MRCAEIAPSHLPSLLLPALAAGTGWRLPSSPMLLDNVAESSDLEDITHRCLQGGPLQGCSSVVIRSTNARRSSKWPQKWLELAEMGNNPRQARPCVSGPLRRRSAENFAPYMTRR